MARQILTKKIVEECAISITEMKKMLRLIVDMNTKTIWPVPKQKNHIDLVADILGVKNSHILKNPDIAKRFIGVVCIIANDLVNEVEIGGTTTITNAGVRYSIKDVEGAAKIVYQYIKKGEPTFSNKFRFNINNKFISD